MQVRYSFNYNLHTVYNSLNLTKILKCHFTINVNGDANQKILANCLQLCSYKKHGSNLMKKAKTFTLFILLSNGIKTQEYVGQKKQSICSYKHENALKSVNFPT